VILCSDDKQAQMITPLIKRRIVPYGMGKGARITARSVRYERMGAAFTAVAGGKVLGTVKLNVPGRYNLLNALAAVAVGLELNIPFKTIASALSGFKGVKRRFEVLGTFKGATVVDDYAHHPTAVAETLKATRNFAGPHRKVLCVFQPHLYSRTQLLRDKFGKAFDEADEVLITAIYPSREKPIPGVTGRTILEALRESGHKHALYVEDKAGLMEYLKEHLSEKYVLLTMGAGDIWKVAHDLVEKHKG
jgi:UDP-N-acetylmuramate--alanine ligase